MTIVAGNVSQFVWYAPYGEALVDEHIAHYENPLKFSGKELDEITGLYDHGARNRNPVSTLWYGIDPLFEKYPDFSPYNYCAGNPVKLVDLDGKEFTEQLEKMAKKYERLLDRQISIYQKKINSSKSDIKKERNTIKMNDLISAKNEVKVLRESSQLYDYRYFNNTTTSLRGESSENRGYVSFNGENSVVTINIERDNIEVFSHEMKHAYQFEIGELSLWGNESNSTYSFAYDITDEIAAYERQSNFSGNNITYKTSSVNYSVLEAKRPKSINIPKGKKDQYYIDVSKRSLTNQAFRVSGKTYYNGIRK